MTHTAYEKFFVSVLYNHGYETFFLRIRVFFRIRVQDTMFPRIYNHGYETFFRYEFFFVRRMRYNKEWSKSHSVLVRILADFGKFYKTRFQRRSSTPPQFWLILPNSTCFSFYTTSNSGWFYEIWLILPNPFPVWIRWPVLGSQNSAEFSWISPLNSAEFVCYIPLSDYRPWRGIYFPTVLLTLTSHSAAYKTKYVNYIKTLYYHTICVDIFRIGLL